MKTPRIEARKPQAQKNLHFKTLTFFKHFYLETHQIKSKDQIKSLVLQISEIFFSFSIILFTKINFIDFMEFMELLGDYGLSCFGAFL